MDTKKVGYATMRPIWKTKVGKERTLVVLFQECIEADSILLQHEFALFKRFLLLGSFLLQFCNFLALDIERHLNRSKIETHGFRHEKSRAMLDVLHT